MIGCFGLAKATKSSAILDCTALVTERGIVGVVVGM